MTSALGAAATVLLAGIGWLIRLRAALVDVFAEIEANIDGLQRLQSDPSSWHPSMLSFEARERSGALLRQGCSRTTCSAVSLAYAQIAPLRTATSGAAVATFGSDRIAEAIEASRRAREHLVQSSDLHKWRGATDAGGGRSRTHAPRGRPGLPPVLWGVLVALVILPVAVFAFVSALSSGGEDPGHPRSAQPAPLGPRALKDATGTVTLCTGKDVSGAHRKARSDFNSKFGPEGLRARIREFPEQADLQYEAFSAIQRAHSGECDVLYSDVIWTADFAQRGWLRDLTRYVEPRRREFVPAMLDTVTFEDKQWGVPKQADAGLLFYRRDAVREAPTTWQDLYRQAQPDKRFRYQARSYEGLTVNFLEIAYAAGARDIVSSDGKANVSQARAVEALRFMVDGLRQGVAPREVVVHKEEQSRRAFFRGRADFMRNWPYVYARARRSSIGADTAVSPLPRWAGGIRASVLGGHNLVISAFSSNPEAALKLVDYLTGTEIVTQDATDFSLAPALQAVWDDPAVQRALPAFEDLQDAIRTAKARPVVPNYLAVSRAIYTNVNAALQGEVSPEDALEAANDQVQLALDAASRRGPG